MNSEDRSTNGSSRRWLERISRMFGSEPQDKQEIYELLKEAGERELLDDDALNMMEGAMLVSERRARDVMTPRSKLEVVKQDADLDEVLGVAIDSAHSRLPVIGETVDEVLGILLQGEPGAVQSARNDAGSAFRTRIHAAESAAEESQTESQPYGDRGR